MSRDGSITLTWGDGDTHFRLAWGDIVKLQEARDCGPYVLLDRLVSGKWRVEDIRETIRWGLIGGGMSPAEAAKKIRLYVEDRPPVENLETAQRILAAGVVGAADEQPGEAKGEAATGSTTSPTEKSGSLRSTAQVQ